MQLIINIPVMFQFFFVLRKKNEHISTLHVIHHGIMPMSVWFGVKFTPGKTFSVYFVGLELDCPTYGPR